MRVASLPLNLKLETENVKLLQLPSGNTISRHQTFLAEANPILLTNTSKCRDVPPSRTLYRRNFLAAPSKSFRCVRACRCAMDVEKSRRNQRACAVAGRRRTFAKQLDFQPAFLLRFAQRGDFRVFIQFNVSAEWQPFVELAMMNQQNLAAVNNKNCDSEINFLVNVHPQDKSQKPGAKETSNSVADNFPLPEPSDSPRGFGVRWLAGNGADTALGWLATLPVKAVCALTPHPPHSKTLAREAKTCADSCADR